ncbi:MAG: hypothetical protein KGN39_07275, partial [Betaproteobacteria bacterium]|nr:hypothetical protein [Betaproteobacteria bacterium]
MTGGYPQAPLYAGWQVAPTPDGGWRAFDTGVVAAVLALSGYSLYHADANGALADLPGRWIWDAHTETLRGELPPLEQELVGSLVERVVARLQAAAQQAGNPANPLVADLIASQILLAPVSP